MRTTLNLDDFLINQLLEATHQKSKTKAITMAIKDYLEHKQLKKILTYQGNLAIENNWQKQEEEELAEYGK